MIGATYSINLKLYLMKKNYYYLRKTVYSTLFFISFMLMAGYSNAQTLLNDNFDYPIGNLYGNNDWWKYGSNPNAPIQVIDQNLTHPGYQDEAVGKAVELTNEASGEDLQKKFMEGDEKILDGAIYVSALMQVKTTGTADKGPGYFLCLTSGTATGSITDGKAGSETGRLFVQPASEGKFNFGVSRSGANATFTEEEYTLGETYLVIIKYEFVEGNTNDIVSLFVNPAETTSEPTANAIYQVGNDGDVSAKNGFQGVELRQGEAFNKTVPNVIIDALRVATSYPALFGGTTPPVEKKPTITVGKATNYNYACIGETYTSTLNVKGKDLTGDITVSGLTSGDVTVSTTTITKEQAESEEGFDLTITLKPTSKEAFMETILFDSEDAKQQSITMYWTPVKAVEVADLQTLTGKDPEEYGTYKYTGEAVVTFIDNKDYYLQDATGGIRLNDNFNSIQAPIAVGDRITGFMATISNSFGVFAIPVDNTPLTKLASGETAEPTTITIADLIANGKKYFNSLVKVENVTFKEVGGQTITEDMTNPLINDGTAEGRMKLFKETDIIGSTAPSEAFTLVGISTSTGGNIVAPRSLKDIIVPVGDPELEITFEKIFEGTAIPINQSTTYAKFIAKAKNLPKPVSIYMTGANGALFTLSAEEIPAGTSTTEIIVTYTPDAVGKHTGRINFDAIPSELTQGFSINAVCIDPDNPPTITLSNTNLPEFTAKVSEKQDQIIEVTTANLPDFGSVAVMQEGEGSFFISSTMLMKTGKQNLTITFQPKKEGTFTERIKFSALGVETYYLTVTGKTTGSDDPDQKEGDDLPLSTANPLTLLNEHFDGVTKNKPLSINGWKNLAMEGKRAWWGHEFGETDEVLGEKAAKITAYDSKIESGEGTPCEMLLVTPPLDYKNSASKMFTFRMMGDLLREGQSDLLEVCYIDMEDGDMYIEPIQMDIPAAPDYNKEWLEVHMDLEGMGDNIADVFFIGFRFKSTRGVDNAATYYIDDVSYGRTDLPKLTPSITQLALEAVMNEDFISEEITITGQNIAEDITLSLGGPNKSKFELTTKTLPAQGGSFAVKFNSDLEGVHEAYVKVSARGAADIYIPISANNKLKGSGIAAIPFEETPDIVVYDVMGRLLKTETQCTRIEQALNNLPEGVYILKAVSESGTRTVKVTIP